MSLILNMEYDRQSMALVLDLTALQCCPPADGNRCVAQENEAFLYSLNVIHGRSYSQIGMYIRNYIAYFSSAAITARLSWDAVRTCENPR